MESKKETQLTKIDEGRQLWIAKREEVLALVATGTEWLETYQVETPKQALQIATPSISLIIRSHGYETFALNVSKLLLNLWTLRHSKTKLTPQITDEFCRWLKQDYYFLKLQEVELAFLNYRGELYQVIDLDVLKTMVEEYDKLRGEAIFSDKGEGGGIEAPRVGVATEIPDSIKELSNKLQVGRHRDKKPAKRFQTLEEALKSTGITNPEDTARRMREQWSREYDSIKRDHAFDKARGLNWELETWSQYLQKKETVFKLQIAKK